MKQVILVLLFLMINMSFAFADCDYELNFIDRNLANAASLAKKMQKKNCSSSYIAKSFRKHNIHFYNKYKKKSSCYLFCGKTKKAANKAHNDDLRTKYIIDTYKTESEAKAASKRRKNKEHEKVIDRLKKYQKQAKTRSDRLDVKMEKKEGRLYEIREEMKKINEEYTLLYEEAPLIYAETDHTGEIKKRKDKWKKLNKRTKKLDLAIDKLVAKNDEEIDKIAEFKKEIMSYNKKIAAAEEEASKLMENVDDEKAKYRLVEEKNQRNNAIDIANAQFLDLEKKGKLMEEFGKDIMDIKYESSMMHVKMNQMMDKYFDRLQNSMMKKYINSQIARVSEKIKKMCEAGSWEQACNKLSGDTNDVYNEWFKWMNDQNRKPDGWFSEKEIEKMRKEAEGVKSK